MLRTRRSLAIAGSAAVALLLISCGVDAGDTATPTPTTAAGSSSSSGSAASTTTEARSSTTEPSKDLTAEQQQLADKMASAYEDLGFTEKEATCLSDGLVGQIDPTGSATPDISAMMDIINQCDISMDRLMDIQGNMGDGTAEGAMKESLARGFKVAGMTEAQADCVAGAFVDEYGMDVEAMTDSSKMRPLAEQCGVDVDKIRPGG
jgi:hypothetical protein